MCGPQALAFLGIGAGGATAAGATAAAATAGGAAAAGGSALAGIGTALATGGALLQGIMGLQAANAQKRALQQQADTEAQLTAVKDQRTRAQFMQAIAKQRAELAARNVTLDSPTAIALGQTAAQEMSFESQAIRSEGGARQAELSAAQRAAGWQGMSSVLRGTFSAAGSLLQAAPDLWPGFDRTGERMLA